MLTVFPSATHRREDNLDIWRACEKTLGAPTATKIYSQFEKGKRKHEHQNPMLEFKKEMS